jgi:hypothetical protein
LVAGWLEYLMTIDDVYVSFWGKPKKQFTEMEIALMEGGHSLENDAKYSFLKQLTENKNESKRIYN